MEEWVREMARDLRKAKNGEKDVVIASYSQLSGKSAASLYRLAAKAGYDSGRKARVDRGTLKSGLTPEQLQLASALIQETARQVKGAILPVTEIKRMMEDAGAMEPDAISASRLAGILRAQEMNGEALLAETPSIKMASLHPNHVHVFDASICIQYYLKRGKGLAIIDERDYREKKPENLSKIKRRLIRMVLADHFSHLMYVKYYEAAGENQQITYDFLTSAWRGGHHEKLSFRGVPFYLLMDAGSANIARGILEFLRRLEIEIPENMPHNPRRQGSAEVAQNIWETHFEARLRLQPASSLEELNSNARDYLVRLNNEMVHRRHKMTRQDCWQRHVRQEHIRDLPPDEILHDLYAEPVVDRTVGKDNSISFKTEEYRVKHIPGIRPGTVVQVSFRPYLYQDCREITVLFGGVEYPVRPVGRIAGGFSADAAIIGMEYKAQPETTAMRHRKMNENLAYGEERKRGAVPFGGTLPVFGHHADRVAAIPIPRRGVPIETGRDMVPKEITIVELLKRVRREIGPVSPELNRKLREEFGEAVSVTEAEAVLEAVRTGGDWQRALPSAIEA